MVRFMINPHKKLFMITQVFTNNSFIICIHTWSYIIAKGKSAKVYSHSGPYFQTQITQKVLSTISTKSIVQISTWEEKKDTRYVSENQTRLQSLNFMAKLLTIPCFNFITKGRPSNIPFQHKLSLYYYYYPLTH